MANGDNWRPAKATIYSADWTDPQGENGGFWNVTYSYWVDGHIHSGSMTDFATASEVTYRAGERLQIEYSQKEPDISRVPTATTYWQKARLPFALGAAMGLIAILLYALTHR